MATKKKHWIQKAIHPSKKGACTPMSKKTCTPARKAFARRAKAGKLQTGGAQLPAPAQVNPQGSPSVANMFPTIDPNYDPLDQMGLHAEPSDFLEQQGSNPGSFVNTGAGQKMAARYNTNSAYIKDANLGMTAITNVANSIQDQKQKRQEYLTTLKSMTPKFMTNNNQGGLNNIPAYTEYGGELDYMMIGGNTQSGQFDYSHKSNEQYGEEGIAHDAFYGKYSVIPTYKSGGEVSSAKAKEILRDGTAQGHALTDKQKRYFGWIAGGRKMMGGYQTGGQTPPTSQQQQPASDAHTEDYYQNSATLAYYKGVLNDKLKAKNPKAYTDYLIGLQQARKTGKPDDVNQYTQNSEYNDYLSPDEIKKAVGSDKDYQRYLNSVKYLNSAQGGNQLKGVVEGNQDINALNYGRRFMGIPLTSSFGSSVEGTTDKNYNRAYNYNPATGKVDVSETGDLSRRPQGFAPVADTTQQASSTGVTASRKYGGKKYMVGGMRSIHQTGGYNVGDEVELTSAQIADLKKQGYKIKVS